MKLTTGIRLQLRQKSDTNHVSQQRAQSAKQLEEARISKIKKLVSEKYFSYVSLML